MESQGLSHHRTPGPEQHAWYCRHMLASLKGQEAGREGGEKSHALSHSFCPCPEGAEVRKAEKMLKEWESGSLSSCHVAGTPSGAPRPEQPGVIPQVQRWIPAQGCLTVVSGQVRIQPPGFAQADHSEGPEFSGRKRAPRCEHEPEQVHCVWKDPPVSPSFH